MPNTVILTGSGVDVRQPNEVQIRIGYVSSERSEKAVSQGRQRPEKLQFTLTVDEAEDFANLILAGVRALRSGLNAG